MQDDADGTILTTGADDLDYLAGHLIWLGLTFEVLDPPELRAHLAALGARLAADHVRAANGVTVVRATLGRRYGGR